MNNNLSDLQLKIEAAKSGVAIYDSSNWGKITIGDRDRLRFLHNQSTADFEKLKPGMGCDTVFVTSTARTIDLSTGLVLEDEVLLIVSPNRREYLFNWLDRYIFFADRVQLVDATDRLASFSLMGRDSEGVLTKLGCVNLADRPLHSHHLEIIGDLEIRIAIGTELGLPGYQLICDRDSAPLLQQKLIDLGAVTIDEHAWECLRIQQGRPKPNAELTEDYNPLEAGLWQTISFNKGCYIGQETIARLNTYKGVKQYLWGLKLTAPISVGTPITINYEKVGVLTSCTETPAGIFGLGYVRAKAGGVGLRVTVGNVEAEIINLPFVCHEYPIL